MSSDSPTSSLEFALRPPDPGQRALDERVKAMSSSERAEVAYQMRRQAFILVNQAADEAGPMSALDADRLRLIRADLARRQDAGSWTGFTRP